MWQSTFARPEKEVTLKGFHKGQNDGRQRRPKSPDNGTSRSTRRLGPGALVTISHKTLRRELGGGTFTIVHVDDGLAELQRNGNVLGTPIALSYLQPAR